MRMLFAILMLWALPAAAEPTHMVFLEDMGGRKAGIYSLDDIDYDPATARPGKDFPLDRRDIRLLQAGSSVIVSDLLPPQDNGQNAAAIAFAPYDPKTLYDILVDYPRYPMNFPSVQQVDTVLRGPDGLPSVLSIEKKSGLFTVRASLRYEHEPNLGKRWRLATESDLGEMRPEELLLMQRTLIKGDFERCDGEWRLIPTLAPALRENRTIIYYRTTVELRGFKARVKSGRKLQEAAEDELPTMIANLLRTAKKIAGLP